VLLRLDSLWGLGASLAYRRDNGMLLGIDVTWLDTGDAPVTTPVLPIVGAIEGEFTERTNLLFEFYASWRPRGSPANVSVTTHNSGYACV
jgi:hypothetical protein